MIARKSQMNLMKTDELQKSIQNLSPDLYSFAYVLIPDDLQASQLMIDCVQSYLVQKRSLVESSSQKSKSMIIQITREELKSDLFKIFFELAKKRYQQLKLSFSAVEQCGGFFALDFEEKALIYLREKSGMKVEHIEMITSMSKAEVIGRLYSARIKFNELIPNQNLFDDVNLDVMSGGVV